MDTGVDTVGMVGVGRPLFFALAGIAIADSAEGGVGRCVWQSEMQKPRCLTPGCQGACASLKPPLHQLDLPGPAAAAEPSVGLPLMAEQTRCRIAEAFA